MPLMAQLGKFLILAGLVLAVLGIFLMLSGKVPWLGRLPGDFYFRGKNVSFYFPLTSSLLISAALTLLFWLIGKK